MAVGIAQLAEHRTVAPTVAGSIPVSHPRFSFQFLLLLILIWLIFAHEAGKLSRRPTLILNQNQLCCHQVPAVRRSGNSVSICASRSILSCAISPSATQCQPG